MSTIVLRSVKGVPLTNAEVDANFSNLNTDKLEASTTATLTNKTINLTNNTLVASSAQLAAAVSDGTGSGALVFANSPTFVTPALGTPASGVVTNLTGTASININGTVGATTASTGAFTTLTTSSTVTLNGGTANGVAYLDASKVLTSGSALVFDGTNFGVGGSPSAWGGAGSTRKAIQNGAASFVETVAAGATGTQVYSNAYVDSNNDAKFILNGYATAYQQFDGTHSWLTSTVSGSAGGTALFANRMSLNPAGNLQIDGSLTSAGASNSGNLTFTGTGNRITGDFSNATAGNRVAFQTSTANSQTAVLAIPNGTSTTAQWQAYNNSDSGNASFLGLAAVGATDVRITSGITGTGTYLPMTFYTGGSERLRIDTSGNVGIGVVPSAWASGNNFIDVDASASFGAFGSTDSMTLANAYWNGSNWIRKNANNAWRMVMESASGAPSWTFQYAGNSTAGSTISWSEAMRLDSSGNVGIGTSSPSGKLHVLSASGVQRIISEVTGTTESDSAQIRTVNGAVVTQIESYSTTGLGYVGTVSAHPFAFLSSGVERMRIDSSGNVGIGTSTTTNGNLTIQQASATTGGPVLTLWNSNGSAGNTCGYLRFFSNFTARAQIHSVIDAGSPFAGNLIFSTGEGTLTERARIESSGNLLVGTTSGNSDNRMTVVNTAYGSSVALWNKVVTVSGTGYFHTFQLNGSDVGTISTNGSATAYNTSSDYRLKNVTGPVTNSGAYIDSLNPVEGTWKADGSTFVGLIAHEVQEASRTPVATGTKDGEQMQGMDYSSAEIIGNLIAEVKSLRQRLAAAGI